MHRITLGVRRRWWVAGCRAAVFGWAAVIACSYGGTAWAQSASGTATGEMLPMQAVEDDQPTAGDDAKKAADDTAKQPGAGKSAEASPAGKKQGVAAVVDDKATGQNQGGQKQGGKKPAAKKPPRRKPKRNPRNAPLTPDPNAKWACDKTTVTAEPVWRSSGKSVDFTFMIRNEGTANLKIRAKGG
jgi:hypothetical protein